MNCINLKVRSERYKKYIYCVNKKAKITYSECYGCEAKEFREPKKIKGKRHERTKKTEIPTKVKTEVWNRDNHKCIFCGVEVDVFFANAHFIPRSAGGLGVVKNIFTACPKCHFEQDNGLNTKEYDLKVESYLKSIYGDTWIKEDLIYKKRRISFYEYRRTT